tara:strand:+ start:249 stop:512 length:264 start_codon:yes stop_codon:yes gene_type:complete
LKIIDQRLPPDFTKDRQQKLPDFVLRLEETLYRGARSKENYCDKVTLEARLLAVAKVVVHESDALHALSALHALYDDNWPRCTMMLV